MLLTCSKTEPSRVSELTPRLIYSHLVPTLNVKGTDLNAPHRSEPAIFHKRKGLWPCPVNAHRICLNRNILSGNCCNLSLFTIRTTRETASLVCDHRPWRFTREPFLLIGNGPQNSSAVRSPRSLPPGQVSPPERARTISSDQSPDPGQIARDSS